MTQQTDQRPGSTVFNRGSQEYRSDVILGDQYRDKITGFVGTATGVYFYQHACERVSLRTLNHDNEVIEHSFDAPELVHLKTEQTPVVDKTGGPERAGAMRSTPSRR